MSTGNINLSSTDACIRYMSDLGRRITNTPESTFYLNQLLDYLRSFDPAEIQTGDRIITIDLGDSVGTPRQFPQVVPNDAQSSNPKVVVVEGTPSPSDVAFVGDTYNVSAETFLGHLELERVKIQDKTSYELPTLPSRRGHVIHVRLVRLGRALQDSRKALDLEFARPKVKEETADYEWNLFDRKKYGSTRFRAVHLQTPRYFIVEQLVTVSITPQRNGSWTAIFLLDKGKSIAADLKLPWSIYSSAGESPNFLPAIEYGRDASVTPRPIVDAAKINPSDLHPYHPLNDCLTAPSQTLLTGDPFYLLCRLYNTAALSWSQLLNYLEDDIRENLERPVTQLAEALVQLRHNLSLTQRVEGFILADLTTIEQRGASHWPRIDDKSHFGEVKKMDDDQRDLTRDFTELLRRCKDLARRCEVGSGSLQSQISILEARRSTSQNEAVQKLTRLASAFVPLSYVASVYGMNVEEISKHNPPLWTFFLISTIISMMVYFVLSNTARKHLILAFNHLFNRNRVNHTTQRKVAIV